MMKKRKERNKEESRITNLDFMCLFFSVFALSIKRLGHF